jgi:hypothetical protein
VICRCKKATDAYFANISENHVTLTPATVHEKNYLDLQVKITGTAAPKIDTQGCSSALL